MMLRGSIRIQCRKSRSWHFVALFLRMDLTSHQLKPGPAKIKASDVPSRPTQTKLFQIRLSTERIQKDSIQQKTCPPPPQLQSSKRLLRLHGLLQIKGISPGRRLDLLGFGLGSSRDVGDGGLVLGLQHGDMLYHPLNLRLRLGRLGPRARVTLIHLNHGKIFKLLEEKIPLKWIGFLTFHAISMR